MTRKWPVRTPRLLSPFRCRQMHICIAHYLCTHAMPTKRAHILLPDDLLREIDSLVGPRRRSSLLSRDCSNRGTAPKAVAVSGRQGAGWERTGLGETATIPNWPQACGFACEFESCALRTMPGPRPGRAGENGHPIADAPPPRHLRSYRCAALPAGTP